MSSAWWRSGELDVEARQLADFVYELSGEACPAERRDRLAASTALLALERARGHSCVHLEEWAGRPVPFATGDPAERFAWLEEWIRDLRASSLVGTGETPTPLVLDESARLSLLRDHEAERRLAAGLLARSLSAPELAGDRAEALFEGLFGAEADPDQARAARAALRGRFTLITGGPGTGKTTTVVRILALLLAREPQLRIALAAPTGKAAARLAESIRRQRTSLDLPPDLREALPDRVRTVHGLLGYRPDAERFRHHRENPIPADVVVVDEASMIDLLLMDALVDALAPDTRLVLLGDPDQLASVDAGYVLGDVVDAAPDVPALDAAVVELRRNWRFESQPGISRLALAVREGDVQAVFDVLDDDRVPDVARDEPPRQLRELLRPFDARLEEMEGPRDPATLLELQSSMRVLAALRRGVWGVEGLNEAMERRVRARGWPAQGAHYAGRPLLVTQNQPDLHLANGDVGVVAEVARAEGEPTLVAAFEDAGNEPRTVALSRLPAHESAWALTVHKSQGSEYDHVLLVLPPRAHPLVTRELLYTAITRARVSVRLVASAETLRAGVATVGRRHSGLLDRLRGGGPEAGSGGRV